MAELDIRRGEVEEPLYSITEAARYLHIAPATLRAWVSGRSYPRKGGRVGFSKPLIPPAAKATSRLSFLNLVEAHVLRALRTQHSVPMHAVRTALDYAEKEIGIERLLLSKELEAAGRDLFLQKYGELINLSQSGQLALRTLLQGYLRRVERDLEGRPERLYPVVPGQDLAASGEIVIDPRVAFGRPVLTRRGISTAALVDRLDAGESLAAVASDYDLEEEEVAKAVLYERAA